MMKTRDDRERVHALADNELEEAEREALLRRLQEDPVLTAELCDIRRLKDLLNYAYPLPEEEKPVRDRRGGWMRAAAVMLLVGGAFLGGWWIAGGTGDPLAGGFRLAEVRSDPARVLLYVGESDPVKFRAALARARALLERAEEGGTEVYVVTSAGGVDLLRQATSPVAGEIRALKARYASIHFVACNNTLFNLRRKGKPVQLVEGAEVAPSAVGFVVERLKEGWTYMAI